MTQTKLKNFFRKASVESPNCTPDESEDDGGLVIDENFSDDALVKSEVSDNTVSNKKDSAIKKDANEEKTFVINITLQGVPSNKDKINKKHGASSKDKELKLSKIIKPTAKRKIKALFGESSESEMEPEEHKEAKVAENVDVKSKNKESSYTKEKRDSKRISHHHTKKDKLESEKHARHSSPRHIFGGSDSESEKELVIDEGTDFKPSKDLKDSNNTESGFDELTETNTEIVTQSLKDFVSGNSLNSTFSDGDVSNTMLEDSCSVEDDEKLDKAHRLSKQADDVLEKLKKFSELPPDPIPEQDVAKEQKAPEPQKTASVSLSHGKHSEKKRESKHKLSLNKKSKHHTHARRNSTHKTSDKAEKTKHIKEVASKKAEKVDLAELVVKLLMPYYKNKKISSRDLFKITARHIVHQLLAIQVTGKHNNYLSVYFSIPFFIR